MRLIFAATTLFTALFASVLGGALSWNNTHITPRQRVQVGRLDFDMTYQAYPDALLGPNNGVPMAIGSGNVTNTGSLNLEFQRGWIDIMSVNAPRTACRTTSFIGTVINAIPGKTIAPGSSSPAFVAQIAMAPNTSKSCIGKTVSYRVAVTMKAAHAN